MADVAGILGTNKASFVKDLTGKKFMISGMAIEVVADAGDRWKTTNLTTHETVFFKKQVLESAIKLGKAEELSDVARTETE